MVSMEFTQLQLTNCNESYLAVYDGKDEKSTLLEKYCDSKTQKKTILSSGHQIFIILKSLSQKRLSTLPKFEVRYNAQRSAGKNEFYYLKRISH